MKTRKLLLVLASTLCTSSLAWTQTAPASAAPIAAASQLSGTISQFNYGPEGRVEGFLVNRNTLVALPPDWALQIGTTAKPNDPVTGSGVLTSLASGMQLFDPQTLTVNGKIVSLAQPTEPAPYTGSGVIRQLNYGRQGEVNGFVFQNGIIARTPPFGASDISVVRPGASIAVSGFAHVTPLGKTVVEVQSITVSGQTIALNIGPDRFLEPGPGPVRRGPRNAMPPPIPAPGPVPAPDQAAPPPPPPAAPR